ncbi:hypothetical protein LTR66_010925 [Elasticomyces elasticus]|nr:hypothetical protein LTR66_010925 [Elasticomyces elasticus]
MLGLLKLSSERKTAFGAYEIDLRLSDDKGEIRDIKYLAYGVLKDGPELILGNYSIKASDV